MRTLLVFVVLLLSNKLIAQSPDESKIHNLSSSIFKWEVDNKFDSLESVLHEKFVAVSSTGSVQTKSQYLDRLKSGTFVHNKIEIEDSKPTVIENTAIIIGKGNFTITLSGKTNTIHLSYMEVFIRLNTDDPWLLIALKANAL